MKNISKNKKGSTLVMVIIIFAILSILGTTLYSIAVTNGKIGIMTSKMKKNFYFAESGLELAHSALIETIDEGIKQANEKANQALSKINLEDERGNEDSPYIQSDGNIDDDEIKKMQENEFKESYEKFLGMGLASKGEIVNKLNDKLETISDEQSDENKDEKYAIKAEYIKNNKKIDTVRLISTYTRNKVTQSVSATYKLDDAEFSGIYSYESKIVEVPDEDMLKNAISTDANLIIRSSKADLKGDIFVGRDAILQANYNHKKTNLDGNIYCNNFNIENNNKIINVDTLYTKDDLNINSKNSEIMLENYYGYGGGDTHDKSSAIVINDMENNKLTINNDLKILGTAFINTDPDKYQTGESISIKKNYKAYTQEFAEKSDNLNYYNPLVLLETGLNKKIDRFIKVANEESSALDLGNNITIKKLLTEKNEIISKGLLLNKGEPIKTDAISETEGTELKTKVSDLIGNSGKGFTNTFKAVSELVDIEYEKSDEDKKITNESINTSNQSNFKGLMISGGNITLDSDFNFEGIMIASGNITVRKNLDFKGIMIAGGNIVFNSELEANGTIVSSGHIISDYTSKINITNNENYVFKLLAQNEKLTKNLFSNYKDVKKKKIRAYEKLVPSKESSYDINSIIKLDEWKVKYDEK